MKQVKKLMGTFAVLALLVPAVAQVADPVDLGDPLGDVEVGVYEPYDVSPNLGAIVLSATTPSNQHPNYDVVGPDAYYEHFDIDDDLGEEVVLDNLLPGIYSIASSDEGLELSATLVEVRLGEVVPVHFNLQPAEQFGFGLDDFSPFGFGAEPVGLAFSPFDNPEFGSVVISSDDFIDTEYVVTGPNGYSESFEGSATLDDLVPGTYVVAATDEGYQIARNVFEVQLGQRAELVPAALVAVDAAAATEVEAVVYTFESFDADADGLISEEEFVGVFDDAGMFSQFDADADGFVSVEEFDANEGLFQ